MLILNGFNPKETDRTWTQTIWFEIQKINPAAHCLEISGYFTKCGF